MIRKLRARRPEARPDEILDAALTVFTEKGFAAARVDDVAKAAGLSKGAVYLYFDSKEALFEALVRRFAREVVRVGAERFAANAEQDPEAALREAVGFMLNVLADRNASAAPRLVIAEAQRFPAIAQLYRAEVVSIGQQKIADLIARGVARGQFRETPRDVALRAVMGPILAHMMLTHVFADPDAAPLDPDAVADGLVDILLNGLKPRPESEP